MRYLLLSEKGKYKKETLKMKQKSTEKGITGTIVKKEQSGNGNLKRNYLKNESKNEFSKRTILKATIGK